MNEIPRVDPNIKTTKLANLVEEFGGAIIENLVSNELVSKIHEEIEPLVKNSPLGNDEFEGKMTTRTGGLIARSPQIRKLVANPLILSTIEEIFGILISKSIKAS